VPRMGSFQRAFLGYRRPEVDAAVSARDRRLDELKRELAAKAEIESELSCLSGMVIEREREIRILGEQLREANERHERSIASLDAVTARLQEIEAQARGQATRIRMKALREAVEVGRRAQELTDAEAPAAAVREVFEGEVRLEVGPLGDYAQLVGIEDAIGELGATEISVERFSEGRATLSMNLEQPIELLRELEELSSLDFNVRRGGADDAVLGADEESGPGQQAA
jgi:hypothetical protein